MFSSSLISCSTLNAILRGSIKRELANQWMALSVHCSLPSMFPYLLSVHILFAAKSDSVHHFLLDTINVFYPWSQWSSLSTFFSGLPWVSIKGAYFCSACPLTINVFYGGTIDPLLFWLKTQFINTRDFSDILGIHILLSSPTSLLSPDPRI